MPDEIMLELAIGTTDAQTVQDIEAALSAVSPQRWPQDRDPLAILAIAANAGTIISALLDLKDRLSKRSEPPPSIVIKNVNRLELTLPNATEETLRALISDGQEATG
jgi:hypothetical protein